MDTLIVMFQLSLQLEETLRFVTRGYGLTPFDTVVLARISEHPGINCGRLAELMARPRQNVQRTLERLAARELVARDPSPPDPKTCPWLLTPRGKTTFDAVRRLLDDLEGEYGSRSVHVARALTNLRALCMELRVHRTALYALDTVDSLPPPPPTP